MAPPVRCAVWMGIGCLGVAHRVLHSLEFIQPVLDIGSGFAFAGFAFANATAIRHQTESQRID